MKILASGCYVKTCFKILIVSFCHYRVIRGNGTEIVEKKHGKRIRWRQGEYHTHTLIYAYILQKGVYFLTENV